MLYEDLNSRVYPFVTVFRIYLTTVHANRQVPVQLPQLEFYGVLGGFSAAVLIWILIQLWHFKRPAE
jgi:hypothetical protein